MLFDIYLKKFVLILVYLAMISIFFYNIIRAYHHYFWNYRLKKNGLITNMLFMKTKCFPRTEQHN